MSMPLEWDGRRQQLILFVSGIPQQIWIVGEYGQLFGIFANKFLVTFIIYYIIWLTFWDLVLGWVQ